MQSEVNSLREAAARIIDPLCAELRRALDNAEGEPPELRRDAEALWQARNELALCKADAILSLLNAGQAVPVTPENIAKARAEGAPLTAAYKRGYDDCMADIENGVDPRSPEGQAVPGWRMVPTDDAERPFSDSQLPSAMIMAGEDVLAGVDDDHRNYVAGKTIDWDYGMVAVAVYRAMLNAAPPVGRREE